MAVRFTKESAKRIARVVRTVEGETTDLSPHRRKGHATAAVAAGDTFPWNKCFFGYKINPDGDNEREVRIYAGRIGDLNVDEASVSLPQVAGDYYVYYRRGIVGDAMILQQHTDWPTNDVNYKYYVLYQFTVVETVGVFSVTLKQIIRPLMWSELPMGIQNKYLTWDVNGIPIADYIRWV